MKRILLAIGLTFLLTSMLIFGVAATTGSDLNGVTAKLGLMITSLNGMRTDIQGIETGLVNLSPAAPSAREPFVMRFEGGETYTVPEGKRLTVEMVSYIRSGSLVPGTIQPSFTGFVVWETGGQEGIFYFGGTASGWDATGASGSGDFYPAGVVVSGGGTIRIQALSYFYGGNSLEGYSITGYLEDL